MNLEEWKKKYGAGASEPSSDLQSWKNKYANFTPEPIEAPQKIDVATRGIQAFGAGKIETPDEKKYEQKTDLATSVTNDWTSGKRGIQAFGAGDVKSPALDEREDIPDSMLLPRIGGLLENKNWTDADRETAGYILDKMKGSAWDNFMLGITKNSDKYDNAGILAKAATSGNMDDWKSIDDIYNQLSNRYHSGSLAGVTGVLQGTGVLSLADAAAAGIDKLTGDEEKPLTEQINALQLTAQQSAADHPVISGAGNIAGNLASLYGIGKGVKAGTGAIKGFKALPNIVQGVTQSAATFGGLSALQNVGDLATGEKDIESFARDVGINALGGAGGTLVSGLVSSGMARLLTKYGLQTPFAEFARQTLSGTAFAAGNIGTTYPLEEEKPTGHQIATQIGTAFLFSVIRGGISTYKTTTALKARLDQAVTQMKREYDMMASDAKTPQEIQAATERMLQYSKNIRTAISQNYYAGQQQYINETLKALDAMDDYVANIQATAAATVMPGNLLGTQPATPASPPKSPADISTIVEADGFATDNADNQAAVIGAILNGQNISATEPTPQTTQQEPVEAEPATVAESTRIMKENEKEGRKHKFKEADRQSISKQDDETRDITRKAASTAWERLSALEENDILVSLPNALDGDFSEESNWIVTAKYDDGVQLRSIRSGGAVWVFPDGVKTGSALGLVNDVNDGYLMTQEDARVEHEKSLTLPTPETAPTGLQSTQPDQTTGGTKNGKTEITLPGKTGRDILRQGSERNVPQRATEGINIPGARVGISDEAYTAQNEPVRFRYAIVSADSLVTSHDRYGYTNEAYPIEMQPRDRTRASGMLQVDKMSKELNPRRLADSAEAQNGAPIVRNDGVVIGGNGRVLAVKAAYEDGFGTNYETFLRENAAKYGIEGELPPNPVLIRIADNVDNFEKLAQTLNETATATYSATEYSMADANKMVNILDLFIPNDDGRINTSDNRAFISAFVKQVIPETERGGAITKTGELSQTGLSRARNAIFAAAYGDPELSAKLSEYTDDSTKILTNALLNTAPNALYIKTGMENGSLYNINIIEDVIQAARLYEYAKSRDYSISEIINQASVLEEYSPETQAIASFMEANKRSAKQIRLFLNSVYDAINELGDPNQTSLLGGEVGAATKQDIINAAALDYLRNAEVANPNIGFNLDEYNMAAEGRATGSEATASEGEGETVIAAAGNEAAAGELEGQDSFLGTVYGEHDNVDEMVTASEKRWQAERVGNAKKKPMSLSDIINKIRHDYGLSVTTGHIRKKNTLGQYNRSNKGIRSRVTNDLPTISHELGHHIDNKYGITKNLSSALSAELIGNLDPAMKAAYKKTKWKTEGLAEFVRSYLRNSETAAKDYPRFTSYLRNLLPDEELNKLNSFADEINANYALDAETASSSIRLTEEDAEDFRTIREKFEDAFDMVYQAFIDSNRGIKLFDEAVGSNTYKLASNSAYSDSVAYSILTGDITDINGNVIGIGLLKALDGLDTKNEQEFADFNEYLVVKHGPERLKEDMRIFANDNKNTEEWMSSRQAEIERQYPQFKEISERLYKFQREFLKAYGVGTGLVSLDSFNKWGERWNYYVPLNRAKGDKGRIGAKRGFANQNSTIKKAVGSGSDIIAPIDNIVYNIVKMVNAGTRNNVMTNITQAAQKTDGTAIFLEKVPTPIKPTTISLEGVKSKIDNAVEQGVLSGKIDDAASNYMDIILDGIDDILTQYGRGHAKGDIVTVLRNGKPEYWKINDPLLLGSITNMSPPRQSAILEAYGRVSRFMTGNITGTNVIWSIFSNFPRDLMTLFTYSKDKNPLHLFGGIGSAYINKAKGNQADPIYKEYLAMGGGRTSAYTADKNLAKDIRKKVTGDKMKWLNPLEWVEYVSDTIELGPRFAYYKIMRNKGLTPQEAFYESTDVTVNFRRGGSISRQLNKVIPFFNAGVQGLDKFARWVSAADAPKETRTKTAQGRVLAFVAASAVLAGLAWAINSGDDEKKKEYAQLSNYTKNSYWCIPLGDGKYLTIPKPREIAVLTSFMETLTEYYANENKNALNEFYDYFADQCMPNVINDLAKGDLGGAIGSLGIVGVGAYMMANRDFLGKPIVGSGLSNLEKKDQYTDRTSKLAYWIGRAFNQSPQMTDFFFQQVLGGWWKYQKALFPVGSENRDLTLGVQNQYVKDNQYSTDVVNTLYDTLDELSKKHKSNADDMDISIAYKNADSTAKFYSRYYAIAKALPENEKSRGVRQTVLDMIMEFNKSAENGTMTEAQEAVAGICKDQGETEIMPSVMNTYAKDDDDNTYNFSAEEYVEYQTKYLGLYWDYVEDALSENKNKSHNYQVALVRAAKEQAKIIATRDMLPKKYAYEDYDDIKELRDAGIDPAEYSLFKAALDVANDDKSLKQEEVISAIESITGLSDTERYYLFHSRYKSDKNNPFDMILKLPGLGTKKKTSETPTLKLPSLR